MKQLLIDIFAALVIIGAFLFFFQPVTVVGQSMEDSFSEGEILLVSRRAKIANGDVVVFESDLEDDGPMIKEMFFGGKLLIKRVIGVPGDTVTISDDITVNGEKIDEPYAKGKTLPESTTEADGYYVLGDNRENSMDSREFGCVDESRIVGKAIVKIHPDLEIVR